MQKKVLSNVFYSILDKVRILVANVIVSIAVARYLGLADYGRYNFYGVVYAFVKSFACFGMQQIVTKEFTAYKEKQKVILCAAIIVSLITSFITELGIIVLQATIGFLTWIEVELLGIMSVFTVCSVFQYYLTATYQLKNVIKMRNIFAFFNVILYFFLIIRKTTVIWFIVAYTIKECGVLGAAFVAFIKLERKNKHNNHPIERIEILLTIKKIIRLCFPMLLSSISGTIYLRIDQVMIRNMLGEEQLGIYSVGIKIVEVFFVVPTAVVAGVLPYFTEKYIREPKVFWKQFEQLASGINACAYFFAIIIAFLGTEVIHLFYGDEYAAAAGVLITYAWATVPVCMGCIRGIYLSIMEYSKLAFCYSVCAAVTDIGMNYFLIPVFGIMGAVIASIISYLLQGFVFSFFSPKLKRVSKIQVRSLYGFIPLVKEYIGRQKKISFPK